MLDIFEDYGTLVLCLILVLSTLTIRIWGTKKKSEATRTVSEQQIDCHEDFNELVKKNKENRNLSGVTKNYRWTQTETEVEIFVSNGMINHSTGTKDINVLFKPSMIKVEVGKMVAVEGEFFGSVQPDDCTWVIDTSQTGERCVWITVFKTTPGLWECVLKADRKPPTLEINTNDPKSMREVLNVLK